MQPSSSKKHQVTPNVDNSEETTSLKNIVKMSTTHPGAIKEITASPHLIEHASIVSRTLNNLRGNVYHESVMKGANEQFHEDELKKGIITPSISYTNPKPKRKDIEVDCSSGINEGIAIVTGLFGGRIRCNKSQSIKPYINKRLNKSLGQKD